jgi:hypothetical protein
MGEPGSPGTVDRLVGGDVVERCSYRCVRVVEKWRVTCWCASRSNGQYPGFMRDVTAQRGLPKRKFTYAVLVRYLPPLDRSRNHRLPLEMHPTVYHPSTVSCWFPLFEIRSRVSPHHRYPPRRLLVASKNDPISPSSHTQTLPGPIRDLSLPVNRREHRGNNP